MLVCVCLISQQELTITQAQGRGAICLQWPGSFL